MALRSPHSRSSSFSPRLVQPSRCVPRTLARPPDPSLSLCSTLGPRLLSTAEGVGLGFPGIPSLVNQTPCSQPGLGSSRLLVGCSLWEAAVTDAAPYSISGPPLQPAEGRGDQQGGKDTASDGSLRVRAPRPQEAGPGLPEATGGKAQAEGGCRSPPGPGGLQRS